MAGFVGSLIGTILSQWLSDYLATALARRNKGIYEPEFRLVIMIPYILLGVFGAVAFGVSVDRGDPWPVPVILGVAVYAIGCQLGATGTVAYVTDCYRDRAAEAFAGPVFIKNFFTFALTFFINVRKLSPPLHKFLTVIDLDFELWPTRCFRCNCWHPNCKWTDHNSNVRHCLSCSRGSF